ncbi:MAG TPA: flagellar hook-length control protein FliK [Caulobacteraceae bacterium]|nr:flagellar hook-length control protein FliK [Caulobacteraceae bacterium]
MHAAALHAAKTAPPPSDGAVAPAPNGSSDGFSGALAALMALLGPAPAQVTTTDNASDAPSEPAPSATATSAQAPAPVSGRAPANADTAPPATAGASDAGAGAPGQLAEQTQTGADFIAADAQIPLADPAVTTVAPTPPGPAPTTVATTSSPAAAPPIDPRLIPFVAKSALGPSGAGETPTVTAAGPAAGADAPASNAAGPSPPAQPVTSSDAASAPAATPPTSIAGLVLQATAQPAPPAPLTPTGPQPGDRVRGLRTAVGADVATAAVPPAGTGAAVDAKVVAIAATQPDSDGDGASDASPDDGAARSSAPDPAGGQSGSGMQTIATQPAPAAAAAAAAGASANASAALASAHGAEITAQLASQIAGKAGAARTAFDFALEPQGLGRVDVSLKIDSQGQLSAVLSFDNPNAAAEAKSRAGDLQQALQQAGFDVGQSGLSFTFDGGQGQSAAWQGPAAMPYALAAPIADAAPDSAGAQAAAPANRSSAGALDITI